MQRYSAIPLSRLMIWVLLFSSLVSSPILGASIQLGKTPIAVDAETIGRFRNELDRHTPLGSLPDPGYHVGGKCLVASSLDGHTTFESAPQDIPWWIDLRVESVTDNSAALLVGLRARSQNLSGPQPFVGTQHTWSMELIIDPADPQPISQITLSPDSWNSDQGTVAGWMRVDVRTRFTREDGLQIVEFPGSLLLDLAGRFEIRMPSNPGTSNLALTLDQDSSPSYQPCFDEHGIFIGPCDFEDVDPENPCQECGDPNCWTWREVDTSPPGQAS